LRSQSQLQSGVAEGSEIHQDDAAVRFLQGDGGIDGGGRSSGSALGIQESEDARLAGAALRTAQGGGETSESFNQRFTAGAMIQKLARAGAHGGNDVGGLVHFTDGKNRDVGGAGMDEFDRANGTLRILRVDAHENNFGALILQLAQNGVTRSNWETDVAQHGPSQIGALHPAVEYDGLFAVLGQEGDCDPGHDSLLSVHGHATNFQLRSQVTFVIERGRRSGRLPAAFPELYEVSARMLVELDCKAKSGR